jgi:hypothetical protein
MHPPSADVTILRVQSFDLVSRILKLLNWDESEFETRDMERHQGPRRKILTWQIIVGLIAHALPFTGRFSQCLRQFFGMTLSDSALSQRRAQLGTDLFLLIMRETLRPLADARLHPACFFGALRLLGIDGTCWSVSNTPQHLARILKAKTRRGSAAFAKISMSALVELGTHAPLHAALGLDGESEQVLSVLRKINLAEAPLEMVRHMRAVADGAMNPPEAVASYHDALKRASIAPARSLAEDNQITEAALKHD